MEDNELKTITSELFSTEELVEVLVDKIHALVKKVRELEEDMKRIAKGRASQSESFESKLREAEEKISISTGKSISHIENSLDKSKTESEVTSIYVKDEIKDMRKHLISFSKETERIIGDFEKNITKVKSDMMGIISDVVSDGKSHRKSLDGSLKSIREELSEEIKKKKGGGSIPLYVSLNGTVANSKYADVNIINSGGTSANNDSTKRTDITITSGSLSKLAATGTVNGSNAVFTFTSAPIMIVVDEGRAMQKTASDGTVNWTGTTSVTLTVAPVFDIYGF